MGKKQSGFTMLELLVVISIIGILAAVLYASFGEARDDARNKALRVEIKEMQLAFEMYKAQNGSYPAPANCGTDGSSVSCGETSYVDDLVPNFIADLPSHTESGNSSCDIVYFSDAPDYTYYKLTAKNCYYATEVADGIQPDDELARCPSNCTTCGGSTYDETSPAFYESMAVYSPGGECE